MTEDVYLVQRALIGDQRAWELIVTKYRSHLRSIGRSYHLSSDEVDDALQDTWLSAVASLTMLRDAAKVGGWLGTIMRRRSLQAVRDQRQRRERVRTDVDLRELPDAGDGVEEAVLAVERWSVARDAVDRLSARDREFLRQLVAVENGGYEDVARRMCMAVGSVGPTRRRVIQRLRKLLGDECGDRMAVPVARPADGLAQRPIGGGQGRQATGPSRRATA